MWIKEEETDFLHWIFVKKIVFILIENLFPDFFLRKWIISKIIITLTGKNFTLKYSYFESF